MLTTEQIMNMVPGEALDRLVSEYVMGGSCQVPSPRPWSASIECALEALCHARGDGEFVIRSWGGVWPEKLYSCVIYPPGGNSFQGTGRTVSEAIVKAALLAKVG